MNPTIIEKVFQTPLIDTHEHLFEEKERLAGTAHPRIQADDWALLLSHYLDSDLLVAGMPKDGRTTGSSRPGSTRRTSGSSSSRTGRR